jgi:hypothetical protein
MGKQSKPSVQQPLSREAQALPFVIPTRISSHAEPATIARAPFS